MKLIYMYETATLINAMLQDGKLNADGVELYSDIITDINEKGSFKSVGNAKYFVIDN